jgi:hypothetical protein
MDKAAELSDLDDVTIIIEEAAGQFHRGLTAPRDRMDPVLLAIPDDEVPASALARFRRIEPGGGRTISTR